MNSILTERPKKNKFDLSRDVKMTGNIGNLYPAFIQDVIPGDSFRVSTQQMIRFSPLVAPIMHNVNFKLDYFFVPYRLVWNQWKDFITGGEEGDLNDAPSYPKFVANGTRINNYLQKGKLADYLGLPVKGGNTEAGGFNNYNGVGNALEISLLPFRAYQLIYHEYFRDQNVGTEYEQHQTSGFASDADLTDQLTLRKSNWEKDYFTSSLPFLQRGVEINLPISTVEVDKVDFPGSSLFTGDLRYTDSGNIIQGEVSTGLYNQVTLTGTVEEVSINELRKAVALQRWLELMARAGSRYREQIFAIFGERIPDYTVQVPQYLGGGKTPIMISEILSTYAQTGTAATGGSQDRPQGDMSGHGLGLGDDIGFTQSFDEHGIIIGVARVIPKASYIQGLSKFWQKFDKFDHYFPQFANLGEQEVYNKEIFCKGDKTTDNNIFGYQQRYAEYKYSFNRVAGDFRDTLDHWEMSRRFNNHPDLNQSFIECDHTEVSRIFAIEDPDEDKIWMNLYHKVDALRPIPYHSNPSLT